ncbi:MAG: MoaD/ThiS family protein [Kiloniellales bacterium]|nr:MoaD/ThiS family protein [Kiloniellales bacterium]
MTTNATIKLYASLGDYLPSGAVQNAIRLALPGDATIGSALDSLNVPREHCHLVLLNGAFVPPGAREAQAVRDGDTIAVWPPVAGG